MTTLPPLFRAALTRAKLPMPVAEYVFAPGRKFRWDYAWPHNFVCRSERGNEFEAVEVNMPVALEVQGGIWNRGAHGRGIGITRDHEKFSLGAVYGWRILYCTPADLCKPATIDLIRRALEAA